MRAILLILILVVVVALIALATGLLDINTVRGARAPNVSTSGNGVTATGGQTPAFDIETGSVTLGKGKATVPVPTVNVNPANGQPAQQGAAPAATSRQTQSAQPEVVNGNSTQ